MVFLRGSLVAASLLLALPSASLQPRSGQAYAEESPKALTKDEAVLSVENHYSQLIDLTAKVSQKNFLRTLGKTQTFEAKLFLKKPGRLKLDYTNGQNIVIDGREAWFYSKKSEQVIRRTFSDFEHANIPVAFLLGAATIRDDFDVVQPDPKAPRLLEYLEETLDSATRIAVDEHVAGCLRCNAMVRDIASIRSEASRLPELAPAHDLWPGIAARIEPAVGNSCGSRKVPFSPRQRWGHIRSELSMWTSTAWTLSHLWPCLRKSCSSVSVSATAR